MPLDGMDAFVARINSVFEKPPVEAGNIPRREAAVCIDGEKHEADAMLGKKLEGLVFTAQAGEGCEVVACPEVDDADIGICIIPLGKFGTLVQHIAFRVALRAVPGEHALAVRNSLACALFQPPLVDKEFVADDAGQREPPAGRVAEGVAAFLVGRVELNGHDLFKRIQFVLNGWFVTSTDDDDILDACGVEGSQG